MTNLDKELSTKIDNTKTDDENMQGDFHPC